MRRTVLDAGAPGALADFYTWFEAARDGQEIAYYRGDLAFDRDITNFPGADAERVQETDSVNAVAGVVWRGMEEGYLLLSQKRIAPYVTEYLATRVRPGTVRPDFSGRLTNAPHVPA